MILTLWSLTLLSLYIKVQVNILGRHLYIDTARGLGSSHMLDEAELIDRNDLQQFLACADYLSNYGILVLISNTKVAASEVLKGTQLKDFFNPSTLHELIIQILDTLLSKGRPHHWASYLMPDDAGTYKLAASSSTSDSSIALATKYELLMAETRATVSSAEFGNIVDISLRALVSMLLEDLISEFGGSDLVSGMPLAKLLPRIARMSELLLQESNRIWQETCKRIHAPAENLGEFSVDRAVTLLDVFRNSAMICDTSSSLNQLRSVGVWKPPFPNQLRLDVDAGHDALQNRYGVGVIVRDPQGDVLGAKASAIRSPGSIRAVELMARNYVYYMILEMFVSSQIHCRRFKQYLDLLKILVHTVF